MVVSESREALGTVNPGKKRLMINSHEMFTGDFTGNPDMVFPNLKLKQTIEKAAGKRNSDFINSPKLALALLGDPITLNIFLLGYAFQAGMIPLERNSIEQAIHLNGVSVELNLQAFLWGRRASYDMVKIIRIAFPDQATVTSIPLKCDLNEMIRERRHRLILYQNEQYAKRYLKWVEQIRNIENERIPGHTELTMTVARYYFKLLAYKDEYEVVRMYTNNKFHESLKNQFEGDYELRLHLAPPILPRRDPYSGEPLKRSYGL